MVFYVSKFNILLVCLFFYFIRKDDKPNYIKEGVQYIMNTNTALVY